MAEFGTKNDTGTTHDAKESHTVAHKALKLAEELEKKMNANPLKGFQQTLQDNIALFWQRGAAVMVITLLGLTTGRMFEFLNKPGSAGSIWEFWGEMFTATLCLGVLVGSAVYTITMGKDVIYYSIFFTTFALAISIFMTLVAIRTRSYVR